MIRVNTFEDLKNNFSYDGRAIYLIHIPKTGGTSFNCKHLKNWNYEHMFCVGGLTRIPYKDGGFIYHQSPVWRKHNFKFKPNYKIATVRNPFDLLTSYYLHNDDAHTDYGWTNVRHVHNIETFEDFIYKYCDPDFEWHVPQLKKFLFSQMFDREHNCVPDIILKYERLTEGYDMLNKLGFGINTKIYINKSHAKTKKYYEYYSDEMVELVNDFCRRELDMFDYDFMNTKDDTVMYINPEFRYDVKNDVVLD